MAKLEKFTEKFAWDNSNTSGNNILRDGMHVGHKWRFWEHGNDTETFSTLHSLTEHEFNDLKRKLPWVTGAENEDMGITPECNSYLRFSVLLDTLDGKPVTNGALQ
jgi:hypothetical protein